MRVHLVVLVFCCLWNVCVVQVLRPQMANPKFATNNPTLTTIALEKPFCMFDGSMLKGASYKVYLYVIAHSASSSASSVTDSGGKPLGVTFQQTNGGQSGPYRAAEFDVPDCASLPTLSASADPTQAPALLTQYLIRVGNDSSCLYDPNFLDVCNPPLFQDTVYRFKYLLVDKTAGIMKDQTFWSHPIKTKMLKQSAGIDIAPGQRSGGMIAIASILSMLLFLLVAGFLVAIHLAVMGSEDTLTETRCEDDFLEAIVQM